MIKDMNKNTRETKVAMVTMIAVAMLVLGGLIVVPVLTVEVDAQERREVSRGEEPSVPGENMEPGEPAGPEPTDRPRGDRDPEPNNNNNNNFCPTC
jgi:hypothetical protein